MRPPSFSKVNLSPFSMAYTKFSFKAELKMKWAYLGAGEIVFEVRSDADWDFFVLLVLD